MTNENMQYSAHDAQYITQPTYIILPTSYDLQIKLLYEFSEIHIHYFNDWWKIKTSHVYMLKKKQWAKWWNEHGNINVYVMNTPTIGELSLFFF